MTGTQHSRQETAHFDALHGLRGIAAVLVMLGHFTEFTGRRFDLAPSGFLAVDLFFLLSGFVIAVAALSNLNARLGSNRLNLIFFKKPCGMSGAVNSRKTHLAVQRLRSHSKNDSPCAARLSRN